MIFCASGAIEIVYNAVGLYFVSELHYFIVVRQQYDELKLEVGKCKGKIPWVVYGGWNRCLYKCIDGRFGLCALIGIFAKIAPFFIFACY